MEPAARGARKKPAFHYDRRSDSYVMLWKTEKKWAGSCREFALKLDDGSMHTAEFKFTQAQARQARQGRRRGEQLSRAARTH